MEQRTSLIVSGYGTTTYLYYDNGALSSFTTPDGKTFSYTYNKKRGGDAAN
ncbi:MAG: hypothetical protein NZT92_12320 [Abditibacteriales bacterium]|nr:hypothetical protein [Abditibacteriales bacterium]